MTPDRYISVDEEGYLAFDGVRITDAEYGRDLLSRIRPVEGFRFVTETGGHQVFVEAFDEPFVARHIEKAGTGRGRIALPYELSVEFPWNSLSVDEWDRFHGVSEKGVAFVLSRPAQIELFDLLDSFDDDSITVDGQNYAVGPWLKPTAEVNKDQFWTGIYENENPGWELGRETPILPAVLPQLKLSRLRALVLGCGSGHDAAFLAKAGHLVTGLDFSSAAIERARQQYGQVENLKFVQGSAFEPPENWTGQFDLIFEHTFYCAITPDRRNELVRIWRKMLAPGGHLLGVFFVHEKREGPPFGGSEWEVRERLKGHFDFLYWNRWRQSIDKRKNCELVLFARHTGRKT